MDKPQEFMTRRQRRELKRQQMKAGQGRSTARRNLRKWLTVVAVIALLAGGVWWASTNQKPVSPSDVVSTTGVHWHPHLEITIKGERQAIPANIGTTGAHTNNIHTHDDSGTLHIELPGRVTRDQTRLKNFFATWDKTFTPTCIFDKCTGPDGTMTMTVNGEPNTENGEYPMRDGDKIVITFE
jgi:hypothetical protein